MTVIIPDAFKELFGRGQSRRCRYYFYETERLNLHTRVCTEERRNASASVTAAAVAGRLARHTRVRIRLHVLLGVIKMVVFRLTAMAARKT